MIASAVVAVGTLAVAAVETIAAADNFRDTDLQADLAAARADGRSADSTDHWRDTGSPTWTVHRTAAVAAAVADGIAAGRIDCLASASAEQTVGNLSRARLAADSKTAVGQTCSPIHQDP